MSKESIEPELRTVPWAEGRDILRDLRERVFIEEQGVPREVEWDGRDEDCIHVLALLDGNPVGCGRLMPDGKVGRMAVLSDHRGKGVGAAMMSHIVEAAKDKGFARLYLHAQQHAAPFYRRAGFEPRGATFEEAGIPHVSMHLNLENPGVETSTESRGLQGVGYPSPFDQLTLTMANNAQRYLCIQSPSLDRRVFDSAELAEAIAALARRSRQTDIRILIGDPRPLVKQGHRLLNLARRLPSKLRIQVLEEHPEWRGETVVIRDRDGVLYTRDEGGKEAFYEPDSQASTLRHLELFEELWRQSAPSIELRNISL